MKKQILKLTTLSVLLGSSSALASGLYAQMGVGVQQAKGGMEQKFSGPQGDAVKIVNTKNDKSAKLTHEVMEIGSGYNFSNLVSAYVPNLYLGVESTMKISNNNSAKTDKKEGITIQNQGNNVALALNAGYQINQMVAVYAILGMEYQNTRVLSDKEFEVARATDPATATRTGKISNEDVSYGSFNPLIGIGTEVSYGNYSLYAKLTHSLSKSKKLATVEGKGATWDAAAASGAGAAKDATATLNSKVNKSNTALVVGARWYFQ